MKSILTVNIYSSQESTCTCIQCLETTDKLLLHFECDKLISRKDLSLVISKLSILTNASYGLMLRIHVPATLHVQPH